MTNNIPEHLKDLDCSTPSSWRKLIAAWEGLNVETQIIFLNHIKKNCGYSNTRDELYKLAINSENAYIRYLAAMELHGEDEEESDEIKKKIKNDLSPLVQYSLYECDGLDWRHSEIEKNLKLFWKVSHDARLALIRADSKYHTDLLLKIVQEAVNSKIADKIITWDEIDEILSDFIFQPNCKERFQYEYSDWDADNSRAKDLEQLWLIATMLPNGIGKKFIDNLPAKTGKYSEFMSFFKLTEEILNKLSEYNLRRVLGRKDVGVSEFRYELFHDPSINDNIKHASISYNFNISVDMFISYLKQLEDVQKNTLSLSDLGAYACDLSPWLYLAINDEIEVNKDSKYNFDDTFSVVESLKRRLLTIKEKKPDSLNYYIAELNLYILAEEISKMNLEEFDKHLKWLSEYRKNIYSIAKYLNRDNYHDKWKTFKDLNWLVSCEVNSLKVIHAIEHKESQIREVISEFINSESFEDTVQKDVVNIKQQIEDMALILNKNTEYLSSIKNIILIIIAGIIIVKLFF